MALLPLTCTWRGAPRWLHEAAASQQHCLCTGGGPKGLPRLRIALIASPGCFSHLPLALAHKRLANSSTIQALGEAGRPRASSGKEDAACVGLHVLISTRIEYERQAETQLVTSELAPCYLREHMPSASSSATPRPPPASQLNETAGGDSVWAAGTARGERFNKTTWGCLPPPKLSLWPIDICSILSSPSPRVHPAVSLSSDSLSASLPLEGMRVTQSTGGDISDMDKPLMAGLAGFSSCYGLLLAL